MTLLLATIYILFTLLLFIIILYIFFSKQKEGVVNEIESRYRQKYEQQSVQLQLLQNNINSNIQSVVANQQSNLDRIFQYLSENQRTNELKSENIKDTIEKKLTAIEKNNENKLEKIRLTVEEKLHDTLEQRIGSSFKIVSERLEMVYRGLGEMQNLASGVGDLKKVLNNVKTRGIWGEVQLKNILQQVFTPDQYQENVAIKPKSQDRVEFAIKLPHNQGDKTNEVNHNFVFLPIDAKVPLEHYERLVHACENSNPLQVEEFAKIFEANIKKCAKTISSKYIYPPLSTDFAIMFLPIEGMYAEVLRYPGLASFLQQELRVVITGPTTLSALLNSLQVGFKTLAIEKRSSEVWKTLAIIKTEFLRFAEILSKTKLKLEQAEQAISSAEVKTHSINKRLSKLESHSEYSDYLEGGGHLDEVRSHSEQMLVKGEGGKKE